MELEEQSMKKNHKTGLWLFVMMFVLYMIGNLFVGLFLFERIGLFHQLLDVLIPCALYFIFTKQPVLPTLKLNKGLSGRSLWRIFQLFLASFFVKFGVNYLVSAIGNIDAGEVTMRIFDMVPDTFTFFLAVAVVPVILEEVFIRGVILDHFRDVSLLQASVVTGILFGILHVDLGQLGYATALGIVMAAVVMITGSLWAGIWFHFLNNFFSFAVLAGLKALEERYPELFALEEILVETQPVQMSLANRLVIIAVALVVLYFGIRLSLRYLRKMRTENGYQAPESSVSWVRLFVNVPMGIIMFLYVVINVFIRLAAV